MAAFPAVAPRPAAAGLPPGFRIRLNQGSSRWADGSVLIGGSPWRISRLAPSVGDLVRRLAEAGATGIELLSPSDLSAARALLDRGFADPLPPMDRSPATVEVVVPALGHPEHVRELLASMAGEDVVVIDDGSPEPGPLADAATSGGARLRRHGSNRGPAAARNTGLASTSSPIVAFIDSDCVAFPQWPQALAHHFADPCVAAVAPRIIPTDDEGSALERYERTRSSLDMGRRAGLVRPGARVGFVPSAALLVRRSALGSSGFDEDLRFGEDVDLVWRLAEADWLVRYDPTMVVRHRTRTALSDWLRRRFEYGTSAPHLDRRHPGSLTPARPSAWNATALLLVGAGHPVLAAAVVGSATALLWTQVRTIPGAPALAARTVGQGLVADGAALGHLLRREWWPLGASALIASPRSRFARLAATAMVAPIAWEWVTARPPLDPVRYLGLRLMDDAAYGSGVIVSSLRERSLSPLLPRPRMPTWRLRGIASRWRRP